MRSKINYFDPLFLAAPPDIIVFLFLRTKQSSPSTPTNNSDLSETANLPLVIREKDIEYQVGGIWGNSCDLSCAGFKEKGPVSSSQWEPTRGIKFSFLVEPKQNKLVLKSGKQKKNLLPVTATGAL